MMMEKENIAFIARATRYSPNSVGKDMAILSAVRRQLITLGYSCGDIVGEYALEDAVEADAYVSMGRRQDTLNWLGDFERNNVPVVNCTASVMLCNQRTLLFHILEESDIPVPPRLGDDGYWVKRGYGCAECDTDVRYAPDATTAARYRDELFAKGHCQVDTRAHVVGDLVKFYAVAESDFFRYYYPGDDEGEKFGLEQHNGQPHHYPFDEQVLRDIVTRAASLVMLDVYGGDCIIRPDGQPVLIDLNDWPSFSRCRDEAAVAIARCICERIENA